MTLKEQLLSELNQQNEIVQEEIEKLKADINTKERVKQQNAWISEMLSKYR